MASKKKIILVCTGLGGVKRGFETYMHCLANHLAEMPEKQFEFKVFSGYAMPAVKYPHKRIWAISRNAGWLQKLKTTIHQQFHVEQISILPGLVSHILFQQNILIYLGEYQLYCYLFKIRKWFGFRWQLCLHTGGQAMPGLFNVNKDWVHHITNIYWNSCLKNEIPADRMFLIPHMLEMPEQCYYDMAYLSNHTSNGNKKIILSVGSLDQSVKQLISLTEALKPFSNEVYPMFIGGSTSETSAIREKLKQYFGNDFWMGEVSFSELPSLYAQADLVVSASKKESFGLVLLEAMLQNTSVYVFKWEGSEWVFGDKANYFTVENPEEMGKEIMALLRQHGRGYKQNCLRQYVSDRYSWQAVSNDYYTMFKVLSDSKGQ